MFECASTDGACESATDGVIGPLPSVRWNRNAALPQSFSLDLKKVGLYGGGATKPP